MDGGGTVTDREAMIALATPAPEPFKQVRWKHHDYVKWDKWNHRRIKALHHAWKAV